MISLIIPTTSTNQNYTNNIIKNIREFYPNENEVEIIIEINDNVNLGENYNNAVAKANGEKINQKPKKKHATTVQLFFS